MTYGWEFASTPAGRVLRAIQLRGRATIRDVAADLGVTPSAVRPSLAQLQGWGAIRSAKVHDGVGRPHFLYSVTAEAHNFFRKDYGDLARLVLEEVARTQGADVLESVLSGVAGGLADQYRSQIGQEQLDGRVEAWAALLGRRGVAVTIERTDDGYLLSEYGCPFQNVAAAHRAVCEMERQVMARLLEAAVGLSRCALDGHDGCRFLVQGTNNE